MIAFRVGSAMFSLSKLMRDSKNWSTYTNKKINDGVILYMLRKTIFYSQNLEKSSFASAQVHLYTCTIVQMREPHVQG